MRTPQKFGWMIALFYCLVDQVATMDFLCGSGEWFTGFVEAAQLTFQVASYGYEDYIAFGASGVLDGSTEGAYVFIYQEHGPAPLYSLHMSQVELSTGTVQVSGIKRISMS